MVGKPFALFFTGLMLLLCVSGAQETPAPDESLSVQAHALIESGNLDQAKTLLTQFTEQFPSSSLAPDAQYFLGWIAWKQNKLSDAEAAWKTVAVTYPASPQAATALFRVTTLHYKAKATRDSLITEYERIVTDHPSSPEAEESKFSIGKLWLRDPPDFAKSLQTFSQLKDSSASPKWRAEAMTNTGLAYLQRYYNQKETNAADLQMALDTLAAVRTQFPDQGDAVSRAEIRLARYHLEVKGDSAKAKSILEKVVSTYPASTQIVEAKYHLATCLRASGDIQACIDGCRQILAQHPSSEWCDYVLYYIGNSQYELGRRGVHFYVSTGDRAVSVRSVGSSS